MLDADYVKSLGTHDVVYSWGVLHHTGEMWRAVANTAERVRPAGLLYIAIYNDQGNKSARWRRIKRLYNELPRPLRVPYAVAVMFGDYVRGWTRQRERGMSRWHDLVDWVGGYPFEVATPEEIFRFCRARGFELVDLTTAGGGIGCNEFVFRRV